MAKTGNGMRIKAEIDQPGWFLEFLKSGVSGDKSTELYNKVALFRQCLKLRCDSISGIPYQLTDAKGKEIAWGELFPASSLTELIWKTEAGFLLAGQAFWEIGRNVYGHVKGLNFINSFAVDVEYKNGEYHFLLNKQENGAHGQRLVNKPFENVYEVVHFREYNPTSDVYAGRGDAQVAGISASLMHEIIRYPESYLSGGALPVTLLGVEDAQPGEAERVASWVKSAGKGLGTFWDRILGVRAKSISPQTLTPPIKDIQLTSLRDLAWQDIISAFGVPDSMVRSSAANYAVAVNDRKSFYEDKLEPRANKFAAVINEQLLAPMGGYKLAFDISQMALFQEDQEKRVTIFGGLRAGGMPVVLAADIAGIELTDDQRTELERYVDETPTVSTPPTSQKKSELESELEKWQRFAEKRVKAGQPLRKFESGIIDPTLKAAIEGALEAASTPEGVRAVFESVIAWRGYP